MRRATSRLAALLLVPVLFTACGGDGGNNLIGPTSTIPNVAGNYSGTISVSLPELGQSASCRATTTVTQGSGGNISIAPIQLGSECGLTSIPLGSTTIDATGSLGSSSGSTRESCGLYTYTASGGFFGRELRMSINMVSSTCYNINMTFTLTRT